MTKRNFARLTWFLADFIPRPRRARFIGWFTLTFRRFRDDQ